MVQTRHEVRWGGRKLELLCERLIAIPRRGRRRDPGAAPQPPSYEVASKPRSTDEGGALAAAERVASPVPACARPIRWLRSPSYSPLPAIARSKIVGFELPTNRSRLRRRCSSAPSTCRRHQHCPRTPVPVRGRWSGEHRIAREPSSPSYSLAADFLPDLAFLAGSTVIASASVYVATSLSPTLAFSKCTSGPAFTW
jgi:hypothetical protein